MRGAGDGKPEVGASASTLGVRVPADIQPDASGMVQPGTNGMSVSPSLAILPYWMVPIRLRHLRPDATGRNSLQVWNMGSGPFVAARVADGLMLRPDPGRPNHGYVEPDGSMMLNVYVEAIQAMRGAWQVDET